MSKLTAKQRSFLSNIFPNRNNFSKHECEFYDHDIAAMPNLIKPLVGNTRPDGVVQPETEEELVALVRWAAKDGIRLTPRAKASSGYGGVLPVKNGVVVDFFRMNRVLCINKESLTATVQPGIVWEKIDAALEKEELGLKLYPSSYPGSTVGGWLAQGGTGIGSFESGWFRDNVVSARAVLGDGNIKDFSGADLELVSDAEGTTGLISEITIKVQPREEMDIVAIGCPNAHDTQHLIQAIVDEKMPIWSMLFINPRMAEMKNKAPLIEHHDQPTEERVLLPGSYIISLAFRKKDAGNIRQKLSGLTKSYEAELLSHRIAQHEWDNRFKLMVVKRLGPSLVPAEVVVPLEELGNVMDDIEAKVDQPVVKEGVILQQGSGGKPEVVILGFIPSDQRKFSYNFVFSLTLTIIKIAEKHGGRPYATGLYFTCKAVAVLGKERIRRLKDFKARTDPKNILNPGKVSAGGLLGMMVGIASVLEFLIRPFGNAVITKVGETPTREVKGIPADVAWYAYACSQCGYCVEECDQFYGRGWESQSPRGKWYWLRKYLEGHTKWNQSMVDTILACTTCELCNLRCSAALPIEPSWLKLRGKLIHHDKRMTFPPFYMMDAATNSQGNIWAGFRKNRADWFPPDLLAKHGPEHRAGTVYFAGCTASYVEIDIAQATVRLLDDAGIDFTYLGNNENCCATPFLMSGLWDTFTTTMKKNIEEVKAVGANSIITSCPACDMMWRHEYPKWAAKLGIDYDIKAKHYSEVIAEKIRDGDFKFPANNLKPTRVTWHDSCHIGRVSGVYEPPRELIKAIPNIELAEMMHNRNNGHCCGSVLTLIKDPATAATIGSMRLEEAQEIGAEKVLALCPCCQVQLRISADKNNIPVEIVDLANFTASALGHQFPDPLPEVQRQWGVFDAFIGLMTPQGFAELMAKMWPELIDAMPYRMGPIMRVMGKLPCILTLMKSLFPTLFPILLPMMMPKVMPTMLKRVAEQIPMPDNMLELMPDMMPQVMDKLMPHMISEVVPLIAQPMIDYLRGKS
ncbi:FAD-binding and (Fe-S)-binding domain-containing protein [Chloroflexota bacterium]